MAMVRIPLVGQSYPAWSVAGSSQSTLNVYPEPFEDANEKEKGGGMLIGCPGKHLFKDMTVIDAAMTPIRGIWSGGGRVFVAGGTKYCEINSAGTLVGSVRTIADDSAHSPVTFFANGNQLFIVSANTCYIDNGSGPTAITLDTFSGTAIALAFNTNWLSGDYFDPGMVGQNITVNGTTKVVATYQSPTLVTVTVTWGGSPVAGDYTSSATLNASSGAYLDGYFIASRSSTKQFNISDLFDGTDGGTNKWDPLAFGQKESYPDYIRSILVAGEQLYLFGTESFEVWQNVGGADFPFQRIDGATGKMGVSSPWSAIAINGKVFFHASSSDGRISAYVMDGFTPRRVSTYAQEADWKNTNFGATVVSMAYQEEGHYFWGMDIGSDGTIAYNWYYDLNTGLWHQRARYSAGNYAAYGTTYHTFVTNSTTPGGETSPSWGVAGKHLVGGRTTGKIYEQNLAYYDDDGTDIKGQRILPYAYNDGNYIYFGRTEVEMQTGTVASGAAPDLTMDYSDDRGITFADSQTASIGVHNNYSIVVLFPPTGASPNRLYRFSWIGQSKIAMVCVNQDRVLGSV